MKICKMHQTFEANG